MSRTIHCCVDIAGVLRYSDAELSKLFTENGVKKPGSYVRDWLKLQLAQGKKVLPFGEPCNGFSYETGCPGHEVASPTPPPVIQATVTKGGGQ